MGRTTGVLAAGSRMLRLVMAILRMMLQNLGVTCNSGAVALALKEFSCTGRAVLSCDRPY